MQLNPWTTAAKVPPICRICAALPPLACGTFAAQVRHFCGTFAALVRHYSAKTPRNNRQNILENQARSVPTNPSAKSQPGARRGVPENHDSASLAYARTVDLLQSPHLRNSLDSCARHLLPYNPLPQSKGRYDNIQKFNNNHQYLCHIPSVYALLEFKLSSERIQI